MYSAEVTSWHYCCPCQRFICFVVFFWKIQFRWMNLLKNFCQISCPPAGSGHNRQGPQLFNFKHIQDCDSHLSGNIPQVVRNKKAEYPVITLIHHHYLALRLHGQVSLSCLCFWIISRLTGTPRCAKSAANCPPRSSNVRRVDLWIKSWVFDLWVSMVMKQWSCWYFEDMGYFLRKRLLDLRWSGKTITKQLQLEYLKKSRFQFYLGCIWLQFNVYWMPIKNSIGTFFHVFSKAES